MTEDEIVQFMTGLPGVTAITASRDNGAPEVAWGDIFFYYDPPGDVPDRKMPFATIVTQDYHGFDEYSNLDRSGVFRLNIGVGRTRFQELLGYPPEAEPPQHGDVDYAALDRVLPHPVYATQGWISILNPGESTSDVARSLLRETHARAANRKRATR